MPVWFVAWPQLEAAMADGILTMPKLEGLPSRLIGSASFFKETLHPTGGAVVPMINIVACGLLEDGRSFQMHVTGAGVNAPNASIEFE